MVTIAHFAVYLTMPVAMLLAQEPHGFEKLPPVVRAKMLAALAGLALLGVAMILLAWLGARATRRYMNSSAQVDNSYQWARNREDDWASKPLLGSDRGSQTAEDGD